MMRKLGLSGFHGIPNRGLLDLLTLPLCHFAVRPAAAGKYTRHASCVLRPVGSAQVHHECVNT